MKPVKKKKPKPKIKSFICELCDKKFTEKASYQLHVQTHSSDYPYQCEICNERFKVKKYVSRHVKRKHTAPTKNKCSVCEKTFHFPSDLRDHMRVHTGEKPNKCKVCKKAFSSTYCLQIHMHIHTGEKPYKCIFCDYACRDNSTLRRHQERHLGVTKYYNCNICDKTFSKKKDLERHIDEIHFGIDVRIFTCHHCEKTFKTNAVLTSHIRTVHEKLHRVKCEVCGIIINRNNLKVHLRTHIDVRPYKCTYKKCGRRFKEMLGLRKHYRIHFPSKQFECDLCGRKFTRTTRLRAHARDHLAVGNNAQCAYCMELFKNKIGLGIHISQKHLNNCKQYICDACDIVLYSRKLIKLHLDYGHGLENDLKCKICVKDLKDKLDLKYHYLNEHRVHYVVLDGKKNLLRDVINNKKMKQEIFDDSSQDTNLDYVYEIEISKQERFEDILTQNIEPTDIELDSTPQKNTQLDYRQLNNTQLDSTQLDDTRDTQQENTKFDSTQPKKIQIKNKKRNKTKRNTPTNNTQQIDQDPDTYIRYSKKVLSEDVSRIIPELEDSTEEDVLDKLFVAHVVKNKKDDKMVLPKKTVSERDINKVEKSIEELLFNVRKEKEYQLIEEVRLNYNKRILENQVRSESKEPKSVIKYYKNPAKSTNPIITCEDVDIEDVINSNNDKTAAIIGNDCNNVNNNENGESIDKNNDEEGVVKQSIIEEYNENLDNTNIENNKEEVDSNKINTRNKSKNNNNNTVNDELDSEEEDENYSENSEESDFEMEETEKKYNKIQFNAHQCHICFKLFKTKTELKRHCTIHFDLCSEKMLKKCPFCGYVTNLNIQGHIKRMHNIKIQIPYGRIQEKPLESGSRFVYEIEKDLNLEVIPSISNLNKIASVKLDKKNRDDKNHFIGKTKLVKKGNEWIIAKEAIKINNDNLLPEFSAEEYKKTKIIPKDNIDRLRILSILAKKNGIVFFYPCDFCEKVCQNLSALRLHNRKHETNPKPFKQKVWKNRIVKKNNHKNKKYAHKNVAKVTNQNYSIQTAVNTSIPKGRNKLVRVNETNAIINKKKDIKNKNNTTEVENRYAEPNPVKNKHKCDKALIEFYKNNIKGKDIEFWQFLKIFNKMTRDNVNNFEDLENSKDFGIHTEFKTQNNSNNTHNNTNSGNTVNNTDIDTNKSVTDNTRCNISKIKNYKNTHNNKNIIRNRVNKKVAKSSKVKKKIKIVLLSRKEMLLRNNLKNEMRKRLEVKHSV